MKRILAFIIFCGWGLMAIYAMLHHEIWRDEMRALSIAIQSPSFFQLPNYLVNEGHPILWYFLLKLGYSLFHSTYVLPVLSILFAAGIAWLLLFRSPFPLLFSGLIIFGNWGLYEYGINCRNYGIGAFLLLLFADLRYRKPEKITLQFIVLAIAAQANVYAAMMSLLLAGWIVFETYKKEKSFKKTALGFGLTIVSFLFTTYITMPSADSLVLVNEQQNLKVLTKVWDVGYGFTEMLYVSFSYKHGLLTAILWLSLLAFVPRPRVIIFLFITQLAMSFFALYYRMNFLQHQGMWIYTYIAMLWINYKEIREIFVLKSKWMYPVSVGVLVFSFILYTAFIKGKDSYNYDLNGLRSDSKDAGKWFASNIKPEDVVISEPDYMMESAVYYHYQPFYLPREKVFNTYVHFTKANAEVMSLKTLNHISDSFSATGKTTYLVLGKNFTRDTIYRYSYNKQYSVDSASLAVLKTNYQLMDSFNNNWFCDEHYFIFKRKPILATKAPSH